MNNIQINISHREFVTYLQKHNSTKNTFSLSKAEFGADTIVELSVIDDQLFNITFNTLISKPKEQRYYKLFKTKCMLDTQVNGFVNIKYEVVMKSFTIISVVFFVLVWFGIAIIDLVKEGKLHSNFIIFTILALISIPYGIIKGKRDIVKKTKLFIELLPSIMDKEKLPQPFSV